MERLSSFIIENITTVSQKEILITIRNGDLVKSFEIDLSSPNSLSFPENLELLLLNKDFNYHREFFKIIRDYENGLKIKFPIILFDRNKSIDRELQAA